MASKQAQKKNFNGMSYREVQLTNSVNRDKLRKEDKKWLKNNGYKNVGWDHIIKLYQKTEEFLSKYEFDDLTLEELFLEADRIGNKYLTKQEVEDYNQQLSREVSEISEEIDRHFPDTEVEIIDFGKKAKTKAIKKKI
jgi:hypothetical protein